MNAKPPLFARIIIHTVFILFCIACLLPLVAVVSISFSSQGDILKYGYRLIPHAVDLTAYKFIFANPKQLLNGYAISLFVSIVGTIVSLIISSLLAYTISRKDFIFRKQISFMVLFTMLFSAGLVPWYIMIVNYLKLKDSVLALIAPYLVVAWFVLLLRTFLKDIPESILESASIDGATEWVVFFKIVMPLSKPALATISLFIMLQYWNDWYLGMLFIETPSKIPLQYMLVRMMANINFLTQQMANMPAGFDISSIPRENARMAMCILAVGPLLFVFPFFQKYFVKGLTVGAVKG